MSSFNSETLAYINNNNLIGIKAGNSRDTFLNIWMVVVDGRVFARSWGLAEKSWFNTFIAEKEGEIKCGEKVVAVKAIIPGDLENLNEKISQAYLKKYDMGDNSFYAHGITKPEHVSKTMEFIFLNK